MAKYFMTWEANESLLPTDPKEKGALVLKLAEMTKQTMKEGKVKDWGTFLGGAKGYVIAEGSALEIFQEAEKFAPYVSFNVQEVLSIDDLMKTFKAMMG